MWQFPLVDKPHGRERDILNMEQDSAPVIENIATIPSKEPLVLPISSDRVVNDHPPPLRTIFPPLVLEEHPVDQPRALRAIIVGAGISGITSGILLPAKVPRLDLVIYERESDISGVWHSNIYPGVRCDIPSHVYQSTFAPSTDWSQHYATGHDIKQYWKRVATKYDVWKYIQLNSQVLGAEWSDSKSKWVVRIRQTNTATKEILTFDDEADFLILATGNFSQPKLPDCPGIEDYQGHLRHSANWDPDFDPTGKSIALIGNGASGLQILPELQKVASHVDHYVRSPTWIASSFHGDDMRRDEPIPEQLRLEFATDATAYHRYRKELENKSWSRFSIAQKNGATNINAQQEYERSMANRLGNRQDLLALVKPDFSPNCRRLTPGPGYLEALTEDNVNYIGTKIERFTTSGIRTIDGLERPADAIICSTGAEISWSTAFPVLNGKGVDLQKSRRPGGSPGFPDTYLGMATSAFPNLLLLLGPNGGPGLAGTLPNTVENQATYIAKILRKVSTQGIRTITPSQAAVEDFRAYCESFFPETVMSENCSSWYNGGIKGGRIGAIWPGSGSHANFIRRDVRWEDFEYTYLTAQKNRFAYFGNGCTTNDLRADRQSTDDNDDGDRVESDFTSYLKVEASTAAGVDLRAYHEAWWEV